MDLRARQRREWPAIEQHLPERAWRASLALLETLPIVVRVTRPRRSKHGDHRLSQCGKFHEITVNSGTNPYQFLITYLHEIAHALSVIHHGPRVPMHGRVWKRYFGQLLADFVTLEAFPPDLAVAIHQYSLSPSYSSSTDTALQRALRAFDTSDQKPLVEELRLGTRFKLHGPQIFVKGPLLRKHFRCTTEQGQIYRVAASARVEKILE